MSKSDRCSGVYAAALTPLNENGEVQPEGIHLLLDHLRGLGCHGVLLSGTTGEGPSFSFDKRMILVQEALEWRESTPDFPILVGTGTPSLDETIRLTKTVFDVGVDGVVVLPPFYFRKVSDDGLFAWYSKVIEKAVPTGGAFFGYHIPGVTGISLSLDLLARLKDAFADRFAGIKDSSASAETAAELGKRFGSELSVFNGTDPLFSLALENHAAGCITALANLRGRDLRLVWDGYQLGNPDQAAQQRLAAVRAITDRYAPAAPLLKYLVSQAYGLPYWMVLPPLNQLSVARQLAVLAELNALPFVWRA